MSALIKPKRRDADLRQLQHHYAFGKNWRHFSAGIDEDRILAATNELQRLVGRKSLAEESFLDIGSGSGLHLVAAHRLGASPLFGVDIDPDSVTTSKAVIERWAPGARATIECASIFDKHPLLEGHYSVVYSWGVLHHTGAMRDALAAAAGCVSPDGALVVALYRKTPWDRPWRWEKRIYSRGGRAVRAVLRGPYRAALWTHSVGRGKSPRGEDADYGRRRGMSRDHDIEDWLGGFPYETISPEEMHAFARRSGMVVAKEWVTPVSWFSGLLGSGCDEYRLEPAS